MNWWKSSVSESSAATPERLAVIWAPDVMTVPGKPPTRGFGGRVYFYNQADKSIPVEGQLLIYGYDDSVKSNSPQRQPDRKFGFTPEQLKTHLGNSELGPSYSIWIPWDAAGGEQKQVSLVAVFTSTNGKMVMSPQATNVLPGRQVDPNQRPMNQVEVTRTLTVDPPVRPATYFDHLSANAQQTSQSYQGGNGSEPGMFASGAQGLAPAHAANTRVTTINMTDSLTRQAGATATTQSGNGGLETLPESASEPLIAPSAPSLARPGMMGAGGNVPAMNSGASQNAPLTAAQMQLLQAAGVTPPQSTMVDANGVSSANGAASYGPPATAANLGNAATGNAWPFNGTSNPQTPQLPDRFAPPRSQAPVVPNAPPSRGLVPN